jgi:hypothetical protein
MSLPCSYISSIVLEIGDALRPAVKGDYFKWAMELQLE